VAIITLSPWHLQLNDYLKAQDELWKLKYFTMQKNVVFKKIPQKETKIIQRYIISL
jgi:hypothetical protein